MKRSAVPFVAIIAVAALVGLLVYGVAQRSDDKTLDEAVTKGEHPTAPSRNLPVLDGTGTSSPDAYKGKVVVLNFWASWCQPCKDEAPILEKAQKQLQANGTGTVLGVTYRDLTDDAKAFVRKHGLTYPSIRDIDGKLAQQYGTRALPETFVIDPKGKIVALSRGEVSERFLMRAIDEAQKS